MAPMTDEELEELLDACVMQVIEESIARARARSKGQLPTIIGGQMPIDEYAATRPLDRREAKEEA